MRDIRDHTRLIVVRCLCSLTHLGSRPVGCSHELELLPRCPRLNLLFGRRCLSTGSIGSSSESVLGQLGTQQLLQLSVGSVSSSRVHLIEPLLTLGVLGLLLGGFRHLAWKIVHIL